MDRTFFYAGELPAAEDFLSTQRETVREFARIAQALTGGGPVVDGVGCAPTQPASMAVSLGGGTCFWPTVMDGTPFGVLPAELSAAMKLGGYPGGTMPLAAPAAAGTEVAYLVQATFSEPDTDPQVLDYYNAANPAQPLSGPGNTGQQQYKRRVALMVVNAKAGAPAPVGQAQAPAADPGYVPLWTVTVPFGTTAITAGMIAPHPGAPRFRSRLTNAMTVGEMGAFATVAALGNEAAVRAQGDANLHGIVAQEAANRDAADQSINAALGAHVGNLVAMINNEGGARSSADATLTASIQGLREQLSGSFDGNGGMQRFPNGLRIIWGQGACPPNPAGNTSSERRPFPAAFPTGCMVVIACVGGKGQYASGPFSNSGLGWQPSISTVDLASDAFTAIVDNLSAPIVEINKAVPYNYIALGW